MSRLMQWHDMLEDEQDCACPHKDEPESTTVTCCVCTGVPCALAVMHAAEWDADNPPEEDEDARRDR